MPEPTQTTDEGILDRSPPAPRLQTIRLARRRSPWIPAEHASGRRAAREGVYGKIAGRANVGFSQEDWRFILWLAKEFDGTISEAIREIVTQNRVQTEKECTDEGFGIPWE